MTTPLTSRILPVMKYFSIIQLNNLANGINFIGCFASIFHNFWTGKIHHDARFSANDDIAQSGVIGVSCKLISMGRMDRFSDEL